VALACAALAIVAGIVAGWVSMWAAGGSTSALVRVPRQEPLGAYVAQRYDDWDFVEPATRYDGLYYYTIALDPLALGAEHELIDAPAYRYGHPGHGWLALVLSGGSDDALPFTLVVLGLLGLGVAAFAAALVSAEFGLSAWFGLLVAVNPGLLYAVTVDTSEATGAALLGLGLLAWLRGKPWVAGGLFVALCLTKEAFVFVPIGIAIFELIGYARGRRDPALLDKLGVLALGPLALAAWFVYLHEQLGVWSFSEGPENLSLPIAGWVETLQLAGRQQQGFEFQVAAASLPLLVGVAVALISGIVVALRRMRSIVDAIFVPSALLIFCLSWLALLYPKDMLRNVSALLYLMPWVLLGDRQREPETGAFSGAAVNPDPARVPFDDQPG
jgi:hypothetical protein